MKGWAVDLVGGSTGARGVTPHGVGGRNEGVKNAGLWLESETTRSGLFFLQPYFTEDRIVFDGIVPFL